MDSFSWNSSVVFDAPFTRFINGYSQNPGGVDGSTLSSSLVLDSEKGELVRAPVGLGQKKSEEKALAALKNHSEAEKRRRERINAHLNTLRSMVPCSEKMDKAELLREVITHVKEMKRMATEACNSFVIPMDVDEVRVEPHDDREGGPFSIKAYLCCEDGPDVLSHLKQALEDFNLKTVKAEISTLGGRMKNVFIMRSCKEKNVDNPEVRRLLANSAYGALTSVLDKISVQPDFSPRTTLQSKRRRISPFDSSSSSS
ncbi:hypothetical protein GIB67_030094 [Kingdonia uniflora]|uniref:BHLH domain-containing protein n=1 Tax=Kingdonia uniflora TaxID=39325 RepID=A0A7J7L2J4_9MAGN|nr:hypothetical protein GIB67_030094 [Kingdonia uniflora]